MRRPEGFIETIKKTSQIVLRQIIDTRRTLSPSPGLEAIA